MFRAALFQEWPKELRETRVPNHIGGLLVEHNRRLRHRMSEVRGNLPQSSVLVRQQAPRGYGGARRGAARVARSKLNGTGFTKTS